MDGSHRLGGRIRALRREAGLSQADLAGPDLSPSYVSLLEMGKRTPSPNVLRKLAHRLGCTPEDFLDGEREGESAVPGAQPAPSPEEDAAELELRYAEMALRNGDPAAARAAYEQVQSKVTAAEQPRLWYPAETGIAQSLEHEGRLEEAVGRYEALRTAARANRGAEVALLPVVISLCRCYRELGDLSHAVELAETTLAELETLEMTSTLVGVELLSTLVGIYAERGDLHRAAYLASTAIERARAMSRPRALGAAYWNASLVMYRNGRTADAKSLIEKALALYGERDNERALGRLRTAYATVLLQQEEPDAQTARDLLRQSAESLSDLGSTVDLAYCYTSMARAELHLPGGRDEAIGHAQKALELLGPGHRLETARTLLVLAAARLMDGDRTAAQVSYERSALILEASEAGRQAAFAWTELAEVLELSGEESRAKWAYRQGMRCLGYTGGLLRTEHAGPVDGPAPSEPGPR